MIKLTVENPKRIKQAIKLIESKLNIKISYNNKTTFEIKGNELDEFLGEKILTAIDFGFNAEDALILKKEDFSLQFVNIKSHTKKKNFQLIRSRIIGREGRAKATIEELTGSIIVLHENKIGIIVDSNHLDSVVQALISIIQGSKHANVFAYLEKQNRLNRHIDEDDLGLKIKDIN